MEHFPTCRCCSSCMDRALWEVGVAWGGAVEGNRQILEIKMQASLRLP